MPEDNQEVELTPEEEKEQEGDIQLPGEGEGDATQSVKIGEKEYTPEQIADLEKKALGYDNLLPDYTRKSQKLSEFEKGLPEPELKEDQPFYHQKGWKPKDYNELQQALIESEQIGERKMAKRMEDMESNKEQANQQLDDFVGEIKGIDKEFDEDNFYKYVDKHDFPIKTVQDLKSVYSAYKDTRVTVKTEEKKPDFVSEPKSGQKNSFNVPYSEIRKGGSAFDSIRDVLDRIKK